MVNLRKKIQRCDSRISSTISWQHAGNYFSAHRLIIKSQERKFCYGLFEMWAVQSVLFWCHFCSRVLSNSLTFDLYNCSGWPSTPSSTKLHFVMWLEKKSFATNCVQIYLSNINPYPLSEKKWKKCDSIIVEAKENT